MIKQFIFFCTALIILACSGGKEQRLEAKKMDVNERESRMLPQESSIVFQDSRGHFWFGGRDIGVYEWDGKHLEHYTTKQGLPSNNILGIQEDHKGNLFFDTQEGVSKLSNGRFTTLEVIPPDPKNWQLKKNDLWFRSGWDRKGPYRYDGEHLYALEFPEAPQEQQFRKENPNASYSPYGIYTMYRDRKGNMWFGTANVGVCRFDGHSHQWLYEKQLNDTPEGGSFGIRSILEDKQGMFWFSMPQYRYEIEPSEDLRSTTNKLSYKRQKGTPTTEAKGKQHYPYAFTILEDAKGDLWMCSYSDGVWKWDGKTYTQYPILDKDGNPVLLFSLYKDRSGTIWAGSHNAGTYRFDGTIFKKFVE